MRSDYLVTVLIPCHSLKYLPKSIESITQQTFPRQQFEVLLVADRIELDMAEKILSDSNLNFRVVESKSPGIVPALNLGLGNITSEFVARMDEDDLMMPKRLELQYQHLKKNEKTLVVGGQLRLIDADDQAIGYAIYPKKFATNSPKLLEASPIAHPAAMFRRKIVEEIGGYRGFLPEDWDLWVRLSECGQIENLKKIILRYRIHPNQLSREKMYAQSIERQFVATSYFARQLGINDAPTDYGKRSQWLQDTQFQLYRDSVAFCRFDQRTDKNQFLNKILSALLQSPLITSKYLASKIIQKFKNIGV